MKIRAYGDVKVHIRTKDITKKDIVYCLTFNNGKKYIGLTTQELGERLRGHCKDSFDNKRSTFNTKIARAIRKYMEFSVEILNQCEDYEELNESEIEAIEAFNTLEGGYNTCPGGKSTKGFKMSEEAKAKMSKAAKGRPSHTEKVVEQYTKDGKFVAEHESITKAASLYTDSKWGVSNISGCINKRQHTAYGFVWKLKE